MSKKQREKVEDEVRYYQREKSLVRPQGVNMQSGSGHPSTTALPIGLHTSVGATSQSDPSPDSSVYDSQSQQPSSSQVPYSVYNGTNSFANGSGGPRSGVGPPDGPYDTVVPYGYPPTIVAYDIRNTTDFVDSTTFDPLTSQTSTQQQHQPHSTSSHNLTHHHHQQLPHPPQLIQHPIRSSVTVLDPNQMIHIHSEVVAMAVEAHTKTLLMPKELIDREHINASSHELASQLECFKDMKREELWLECAARLTIVIQNIIEFAKIIPVFASKLIQDDQITLLKAGLYSLLLCRFSFILIFILFYQQDVSN